MRRTVNQDRIGPHARGRSKNSGYSSSSMRASSEKSTSHSKPISI